MKYNILYTVYRSSAILYKKRGSKYCDVKDLNSHTFLIKKKPM